MPTPNNTRKVAKRSVKPRNTRSVKVRTMVHARNLTAAQRDAAKEERDKRREKLNALRELAAKARVKAEEAQKGLEDIMASFGSLGFGPPPPAVKEAMATAKETKEHLDDAMGELERMMSGTALRNGGRRRRV
jgi:hypothetical protein